jgi:hypothetical protein
MDADSDVAVLRRDLVEKGKCAGAASANSEHALAAG